SLTLHFHIADTTQSYESIGLNCNRRLIEFRTQLEIQIKRVARSNLVSRRARLKLFFVRSVCNGRFGNDRFISHDLLRQAEWYRKQQQGCKSHPIASLSWRKHAPPGKSQRRAQ